MLQSSKQIQNKADKERTLRESLRLYQQISQHTDLPLVCSQYRQGKEMQDISTISVYIYIYIYTVREIYFLTLLIFSVRFYEGILELCLTAAEKKDPQRLGPHFYKNGEPEQDRVGQQAFQER